MDDPGQVWDELLAWKPPEGSTTDSARARQPLPLRKEPRGYFLTQKPRRVAEIPPALREAIRAAVSGRARWPLFVFGPAGTGKSCTGLCLVDHAGGFYFTAAGLCEELIQSRDGRLLTRESHRPIWPEQWWSELASCPLVVLDDLGTRGLVTDFQFETVKRLLDEREGRPLLATSNLDLTRLAALYDDRVASRLAAGTVVCLNGRDRRLDR